MSGGSFNYLCGKDAVQILESGTEDLRDMANELDALGHLGKPLADATRTIEQKLRNFQREMDAEIQRLEPIWHAVEWWRSCDWSREQVFVAIGEWRERDRRSREVAVSEDLSGV